MRGFIDGEYQDGELRGCTFIAGKRGMGKTTEMARLLSLCSGGVLFFDSLSRHESVLEGYKIISQPGELENYLRVNRARRFYSANSLEMFIEATGAPFPRTLPAARR
jgi:hypothetical protein